MNVRRSMALVILLYCASAACTTIDVKTDYDPSVDFGRFRSFTFAGLTDLNQGGVLNNSLTRKRIETIIARALVQKGLQQVALDEHPDLLVHYWVGIKEKQRIESTGPAMGAYGGRAGYGWGMGYSGVTTYEYKEGTLITDLVEPAKKELVWRATMVANVEDTAQENVELVEKAIAKAYKDFPPKTIAK